MKTRALKAYVYAALALFALVLSACTGSGQEEQSLVVEACQSESEQGPSCQPRNVAGLRILHPRIAGAAFDYEIPSLEEVLESGLYAAGASPTHIAIRGTPLSGTVRCAWRGVALAPDQREAALRLWLGLSSDESLPTPSTIETTFDTYVAELAPPVPRRHARQLRPPRLRRSPAGTASTENPTSGGSILRPDFVSRLSSPTLSNRFEPTPGGGVGEQAAGQGGRDRRLARSWSCRRGP